ncbi:MAG: hypothetical protein LZF86_50144 [Nitrospira sp.]|nr:MAG: hypothetical protein LZF86_50144 [Nitrospira sp.]
MHQGEEAVTTFRFRTILVLLSPGRLTSEAAGPFSPTLTYLAVQEAPVIDRAGLTI